MKYKKLLILTLLLLSAAGCNQQTTITRENSPAVQEAENDQTVDFSKFSSTYQFEATIPSSWKVEHVAGIDSINIYDPSKDGSSLEQSVIFIRNFTANSFLTLGTVEVLSREEAEIKGHAAVKYEIKKKTGVANFVQQPSWRNQQHKLIDIRYNQSNPSPFYVFAYNPELPEASFDAFVDSLIFFNDNN